MTSKRFQSLLWMSVLVWTIVLAIFLIWQGRQEHSQSIELGAAEARASFNKDKATRLWATNHGGVYVPTNERTPPNPFLSHIPERDILTPSGKKLTLMNPAYMLRQMMDDSGDLYGVKGKITSFPDKLLNPNNMPDDWELAALNAFDNGESEVTEVVDINGKAYFRLMQPLYIQQGCLKCHSFQGYKVGDLRGGIAVVVSMTSYFDAEAKTMSFLYIVCSILWVVGIMTIYVLWKYLVGKELEENQREINRELKRISTLDGLTGVLNRRSFDLAIEQEWKRSARHSHPLSLIMIDVDRFKNFNDLYGHLAGDDCLKTVANALGGMPKRAGDNVFRYGGEEFVVLLPETKHDEAMQLAERYRMLVKDNSFRVDMGADRTVTISLGVATKVPKDNESFKQLLAEADCAMYQAKERGRDRVISFDEMT